MKKIIFLVAAMPMFAMAQTKKPAPKVTSKSTVKPYLKSSLDSLCYALGTRIAPNFKNSNIDTINYDAFVQGIKDYLKKKPLKLNDSVCNVVINTKLQELTSKIANKEKSIGKQFLDSNKTKQGIVTTASGLQYEVITMGTGIKPTEQDTVVCHYKGTIHPLITPLVGNKKRSSETFIEIEDIFLLRKINPNKRTILGITF